MKTSAQTKIGIVSGVGPLAGADVLAKVFENAAKLYGAVEDNEYPDLVLLNHGIEGVDNTGALSDKFEQEIVKMVQQLETQGANIIGIACNTAHTYLNKIKVSPETILVNLIDSVSLAAKQLDKNCLLLTSSSTKKLKLYQGCLKKYGVLYSETTSDQQQLLDKAIGQVMAYKLDEAGLLLERVLASARTDGFAAVIAGCTELPIAIGHCKNLSGLQVIDSNQVLSKALLQKYYKK